MGCPVAIVVFVHSNQVPLCVAQREHICESDRSPPFQSDGRTETGRKAAGFVLFIDWSGVDAVTMGRWRSAETASYDDWVGDVRVVCGNGHVRHRDSCGP